jgi:hypothetical protein
MNKNPAIQLISGDPINGSLDENLIDSRLKMLKRASTDGV